MSAATIDVDSYYRQVTDVDIGELARELLAGKITQESATKLFCDCPHHRSQSHRSLHVWLDRQGWFCHGCGVGGDVLQLVEFIQHGGVTRGQSGSMPESHRHARDFLASRVGLPPLSQLGRSPEERSAIEEGHCLTLRVREALTAVADLYHERLMRNAGVLAWFREKYRIGDEAAVRLKIGFADNGEESVTRALLDGPGAFTPRELTATSAFRPTAQDGLVPFFDGRIVFPYWSRGRVVFMIGRRTPWTPDHEWEKSKYKKLSVRNDRNNSHVAPCIRNDVLYNEDVLLTRPERVIITEGVTDCISLMEHGFPVVSPVTVQIREADWERLLPKLTGVKTVFICQDNEVSAAGLNGALRTARALAARGILTRVAALPLGEKQQQARQELTDSFGVDAAIGPREMAKRLEGRTAEDIERAEALLADAKIDVNEFFAAGKSAADFEAILTAAETPLEMAIAKLDAGTPDEQMESLLEPILQEVGQMGPIERERHLRLIQARCGKSKLPVSVLRQQLKVVVLDHNTRRKHSRAQAGAAAGGGPGSKPVFPKIQINDRQLREIVSDAWLAIHGANQHGGTIYPHTPFLFHRAGRLVRLVIGEFGPEIEEMDEDAVFGLLARTADWHRAAEDADVETSPPRDAARDMLAYPDLHLPMLEGVISTPVFGRQGELIMTDGYHRDDRLWLSPDTNLQLGTIPDEPTAEDIAAARTLLIDDLLVDFPFVDDSDRAHAIAAMILPFIRRMIDGPTPMHLIEAPTMGSGKGLLANLISIAATGAACEARTLPEGEDEVRKMLTAELMKGRPIVLLDNANDRKQLHSSSLASVLTSVRWTDRKLGESIMASVPNHAVWLMTGNNPNLHLELTRRCIRVRIDPRVDRPWKRSVFKHPEITTWAKENRSALVGAIVTLIRAWMVAGKPLDRARLGSFERWSSVIGGILGIAGVPGFLANLDQLYEAADVEGQAWRGFTAAWWQAFREQPQKVSELNQFCEERELMLRLRGDGSARSQQIRLGNALGNCRDRSFDGLRVVRADRDTKHKGVTMYALAVVADSGNWGCWGSHGDVADKHPHESNANDSAGYKLFGDVGDVEVVTPRIEREFSQCPEGGAEADTRAHAHREDGKNIPKIPNIPKSSASDCNESTDALGMLDGNIPTTSPNAPDNLGDFTTIKGSCAPIDILAGGTPCQSFSLAGRRGGLEDARGNLAIEFCRLSGRLRPRWIVWENVPGVLSSNGGRDFGSIVGALAELGFGCAWRVLDAQFFGVPQRRRRVFVVGHLGDWRRAAAVLLEREGLCRDTPARRKAREDVAGAPGGGTGERGWCNDLDRSGAFVSMSLNAKGGCGRLDGESETFVASGCGYWNESDSAETLGTQGRALYESTAIVGPLAPTAFSAKDHGADAGPLAPTLRAMPHDRSHANAGGQVAVCFESRVARNGRGGPSEVVPPLKAQSGGTGRGDAAPLLAVGGPLAVRRLTPRECERLQGMPDDYTLIPYRGKPAADGPRYRAIGNSMAVPVMRWIGRRIQMVDSIGG